MKKLALLFIAVVLVIVGLIGTWQRDLEAQQAAPKITELSRTDLPGMEGREVIVFLVELAPGLPIQKHYHPGQSWGTVLEGSVFLQGDNEPRHVYQVGDSWNEAPKHVHWGGNVSATAPVKFMVVRIHPKGQPVTVPVP